MKKTVVTLIAALTITSLLPANVQASGAKAVDTGIKQEVYASGQYANWDGVPSVAQFSGKDGQLCFAYKSGKKIKVVKTQNGKVKKKLSLSMKGKIFGTVVCDSDGNYYAVTGTENSGSDTNKDTVFITKYDASGKLIKSVGDNGRSSLADYYDDSFNTQSPFEGGTCDAAVNGDYVAVHYGRHMYSRHQSNSVWMIDKNTMTSVVPGSEEYYGYAFYESHSFGQRVTPFAGGFAFMSEGDCYDRAFTFGTADFAANTSSESPVFDFWVEKGTFDKYDMYVLNDNFAHIGNICDLGNGTVSFVASSAKAMSEKAAKQREQIFIQIFDPTKDLSTASAYVTSGKRSGVAGKNGDEKKTNYGVKWLTKYTSGSISEPQAVTDGKGNTIVLFERYGDGYDYKGVYSIKVNSEGEVTKKAARVSKNAHLNSCETPIFHNGYVYWCGNKTGSEKLFVFKFKG